MDNLLVGTIGDTDGTVVVALWAENLNFTLDHLSDQRLLFLRCEGDLDLLKELDSGRILSGHAVRRGVLLRLMKGERWAKNCIGVLSPAMAISRIV